VPLADAPLDAAALSVPDADAESVFFADAEPVVFSVAVVLPVVVLPVVVLPVAVVFPVAEVAAWSVDAAI
jgi:hypothetical protein